jgi:hypothetical protein
MRVICEWTRDVSRAVPTGFRLGGCIPKCWPPSIPGPPQKSSPESKNVSGKFWRRGGRGGEVDVIFSKTKVPEIFRKTTFFQKFPKFSAKKSFIFKNFAIPACQGPLPASWAPIFYFFGGVTPPTPPQVTRPGCVLTLPNAQRG